MALEKLQNGRYRLLRLVGKGGMGEVYLMQDERVNRQVAIKVIRSESTPYPEGDTALNATRLFQREAKAIATLEHPHILPLYDFGEEVSEDATLSYMVMPFCAEGSLASWLRTRESKILAPQDVAYFIAQAADALQYAHDLGVIHLDVKPPNFLLRSNKKNPHRPTILLADFGVARSSATLSSSSQTIRGTPTAMAPEQWSSMPVPATDQYALAVMVYEMLTGRPPFVGSMEQLMYQHFTVEPPAISTLNPDLPAALDAVLLRALAKKPEDRFSSIVAFADAFEEAIKDSSTRNEITDQSEALLVDIDIQSSGSLVTSTMPVGMGPSQLATPTDSAEKPVDQPITPLVDKSVGHDLPTVASAWPGQITRPPQQAPKKSTIQRFGVIGIVVVLLLVLSGAWYVIRPSLQKSTQTAAIAAKNTPLAITTVQPTPTATVGITPTPTVANGLYIPDTYKGSTLDNTTQQSSAITVFLTQKKGSGALSGSVTFLSSNQVDPLSGTIDMQGNFSFTVQQPQGQKPLYFFGAVQQQSDGNYLKGQYCASNTSSCISLTGLFYVGPGF